MIFFFKSDGTLIKSAPDTVYQGSVEAGKIYVAMPFNANAAADVYFRLPNGENWGPYLLTNHGVVTDGADVPTGWGLWSVDLESAITQYAGTLTAQFGFTQASGKIKEGETEKYPLLTTSAVTITIAKGVTRYLPKAPSYDVYEVIKKSVNAINEKLDGVSENWLTRTEEATIALKNNGWIGYSTEAAENTLALRDSNGRLKASDGVANDDLVTVKQLNDSETETDNLIEETKTELQGKIDLKLDKPSTGPSGGAVYQNIDGSTKRYALTTELLAASIPLRNDDNTFNVETPKSAKNVANKEYVDEQIAAAHTSVYTYKGSKDTYANLPATGNKVGDVWNVEDTGINYAWNGADWDSLSASVLDSTGDSTVQAMSQKATTDELNKRPTVVANPTLAGTEAELTGLQVGDTKYKMPSASDNAVVVEVGADGIITSTDYDKLVASDNAVISYQQRLYRKSTVSNGFDELQFENSINPRQYAYAFTTNCQVLEDDDDTGIITLNNADGLEVGLNIAFANSSGSIIAGTANRTIKSIDKNTLKMTVTGAALDSEVLPEGSWLLVSFNSTIRNITTASVTSDDATNGTISVADSNVLNVSINQFKNSLYIDFRRENGTKISGLTGRKVLTVNKSTNKITVDGTALATSSLPSGSFITLSDSVSSKELQLRMLRVYKTQPSAINYTVKEVQNALDEIVGAAEKVSITVPKGATKGTLTDEQLATLQANEENYIEMVNDKELYYLNDNGHVDGYLTYSHVGIENSKATIKTLTITVSAKSFVIVTTVVPTDAGGGKLYMHTVTVMKRISEVPCYITLKGYSTSNAEVNTWEKLWSFFDIYEGGFETTGISAGYVYWYYVSAGCSLFGTKVGSFEGVTYTLSLYGRRFNRQSDVYEDMAQGNSADTSTYLWSSEDTTNPVTITDTVTEV